MNKIKFKQFVSYLAEKNLLLGPKYNVEGALHLQEISSPDELYLGADLPIDSWKWFLLPPKTKMFEYSGEKWQETIARVKKQIFLGVSILDLQALTLLNQVFEKDVYYQEIKKKTLVIGTSAVPKDNFLKFFNSFEENKLEHLQFDVFIALRDRDYLLYTGSEDGQRLLDDFGYKNYEHIEYAGPIREEGLDPQMLVIKEAMQNFHKQKIWDDLGHRCIQCGKCTIACPVCFCFRMYDQANVEPNSGTRNRCWDSCFYNEFSQVAGPVPEAPKHRFLNKTAEKIYFWYEHHFVRTPATYSIPGCVGCNRCSRTCPADIDIRQTIKDILAAKAKNIKN